MKSFDLSLPAWGPYNKKYMGTSHIANPERGYRFDVNLFPGYFRRRVMIPWDVEDCNVKIMASSTDVSHYVYRYELEWKDKVYVDADFCIQDDKMQITCEFVNQTDSIESLAVDVLFSMQRITERRKEIKDLKAATGEGTLWIDAMDYADIKTDQSIAQGGLYLGERRGSGFVGGSCLCRQLFGKEGDQTVYVFDGIYADRIGIRYAGSGAISLFIAGVKYDFVLEKSETPCLRYLPIEAGVISRFVYAPHDTMLDVDGFVIGENIAFDNGEEVLTPLVEEKEEGLLLAFGDMEYYVTCDYGNQFLRILETDDPGHLLIENIHNHIRHCLGDGGHTYVDLFLRSICVKPKSSEKITICIKALKEKNIFPVSTELYQINCNNEGKRYKTSQGIMSATTLSNVIWPIYNHRKYVRHNIPGKNWDSLYTWDSGFIGVGLTQLDAHRGEECLNGYLTEEGDIHAPYVFKGTPLPTQILLFLELYHRTGSIDLVRKYYPQIKRQYRFFADARKNGRTKDSGLFSTWDIFYNSGGWDDYPAQVYIHAKKMEDTVCPMVNVSFTVLCGKILKNLASLIGEDTDEYDEDIAFYSEAVNTYGWDEASGYYGYVDHLTGTDKGSAGEAFKAKGAAECRIVKINGVNGNMGMDGAYPYIAGISTPERSARILENIKRGMCTEMGVSVVDIRAPYYRMDGYWNGTVWMPHQWILWKAFLDQGQCDFALYIADTALEVWKREADMTYNCCEFFEIATGRGAGFHQFSGLSTPILAWFRALYVPYTVTSGFFTLISEMKKVEEGFSFHIRSTAQAPVVIVCLPDKAFCRFETSGTVEAMKESVYSISFADPVEETVTIVMCR